MSIINTGFKLPTAVIENASGVAGWINPDNILLVDGDFADSSGPAQIMTVGNFNHNVPQGANILNIIVRLKGYRGSFNTTLNLYAVDDTSGVELSYPYNPPFQSFVGTNTVYTLSATLFATTWTVNQINNLKMKLIADGELHMDSIEVDVIYDDAVAPAPVTPSEGEEVCDEYVQAQPFSLARAFNSDDLVAFLTSFNYPRANGVIDPILIDDFHGEAVLTVDQGQPNEETFLISNVEHDYQGTGQARLTISAITDRGLAFKYGYTHDITRVYNHKGTAEVVISNSARFYNRFLKKCHIGALVSAPIEVLQDDVSKTFPTDKFNFQGAGVQVTQDGLDAQKANINIPGVGTTPPEVNDSGSNTSGSTQVDTLSVEDLVSSGLNRGLLVQIITQEDVSVVDVTYNGVSATQEIVEIDAVNNIRVEQWFLVAPSVGTFDVIVTLSGPAYLVVGAETLTSVNQGTPVGATDTATGNSNSPSMPLTTTTDYALVFDAIGTAITPITYTVGPGQSENWHQTANTDTRQGASSVEAAGTFPDNVMLSWSLTQITNWVMAAIEINGVASAPPVVASLTVEEVDGAPSILNTAKVIVSNGTLSSPGANQAQIETTNVRARTTDTTPGFLDDKIEIDSPDGSISVTKTIQNPGANEKILYSLLGLGGGGGGGSGNKLAIDSSTVVASGGGFGTYTVNIPGGTLGINDGIRFRVLVSLFDRNAGGPDSSYEARLYYGGVEIARSEVFNSALNRGGFIEGYLIANNATNAQTGGITFAAGLATETDDARFDSNVNNITASPAIDSTIDQDLEIRVISANNFQEVTMKGIIVEKISDGSGGINISLTAEEDLTAGDTVGLTTNIDDGAMKAVWAERLASAAAGFDARAVHGVCRLVDDKYALLISDATDYKAIIATLDRDTLTWSFGTASGNINNDFSGNADIVRLGDDKFATAIFDASTNPYIIEVTVCTVVGTVITIGNNDTFSEPSTDNGNNVQCVQLDTDRMAMVIGGTQASSHCDLFEVTVVGNTPTIGTQQILDSNTDRNSYIALVGTNKVAVANGTNLWIAEVAAGVWSVGAPAVCTNTGQTKQYGGMASAATDTVFLSFTGINLQYFTIAGLVPTLVASGSVAIGTLAAQTLVTDQTDVYLIAQQDTADNGAAKLTVSGASIIVSPFAPFDIQDNGSSARDLFANQIIEGSDYFGIAQGNNNATGNNIEFLFHIQGMTQQFVGIAQATTGRGNSVSVKISGIDINQSGLTPGALYNPLQGGLTNVATPGVFTMQATNATEIKV